MGHLDESSEDQYANSADSEGLVHEPLDRNKNSVWMS